MSVSAWRRRPYSGGAGKFSDPSAAARALRQLEQCPCLLVRIEQIHGEIFAFDIAQFVETLVECDVDRRGPRSDSGDTDAELWELLRACGQGPRHGSVPRNLTKSRRLIGSSRRALLK
jgi:hypothetical protein